MTRTALVPLLRRHGRRHDAGCARARRRRRDAGDGDRRRSGRRRLRADVRARAALRHRRHPRDRRHRRPSRARSRSHARPRHTITDHDHDHDDHDHDDDHGHHRPYRAIRELLDGCDLPPACAIERSAPSACWPRSRVACTAWTPTTSSSTRSARVDAIVDVVGTCAALEVLGIDRIVCSPITVGQGHVHAAHGELPNPAPAVVDLLALRSAPSRGIDDHRELATPDRRRADGGAGRRVRPDAGDERDLGRLRRRHPRHPRSAQRRAGGHRRDDHRPSAGARATGRAARVQRRRRHRRGDRPHHHRDC